VAASSPWPLTLSFNSRSSQDGSYGAAGVVAQTARLVFDSLPTSWRRYVGILVGSMVFAQPFVKDTRQAAGVGRFGIEVKRFAEVPLGVLELLLIKCLPGEDHVRRISIEKCPGDPATRSRIGAAPDRVINSHTCHDENSRNESARGDNKLVRSRCPVHPPSVLRVSEPSADEEKAPVGSCISTQPKFRSQQQ
jgi:hypothetical protein